MENITDEKSQKSIKEIILVFSDIDVKITALNECSAEDFLSLNNYLKKFYKDAKVISNQTEQIYDIIAEGTVQAYTLSTATGHHTLIIHIVQGVLNG